MDRVFPTATFVFSFVFLFGASQDAAIPAPTSDQSHQDRAAHQDENNQPTPRSPNIIVPEDFMPILREMTRRSPTFRCQWGRLQQARHLRLRIQLTPSLLSSRYQALSTVVRYHAGLIEITIKIVAPSRNYVELIAHEFEHAIEQVEGLDLRALARTKGSLVYRLEDGSFETERAKQAGRRVTHEFQSFREPDGNHSAAYKGDLD